MSHFTLGVVNVGGGECRGGECRTIIMMMVMVPGPEQKIRNKESFKKNCWESKNGQSLGYQGGRM